MRENVRIVCRLKTDAYIRYFDIKDFLDRQAALLSQRIEHDHVARARHA